MEVSNQVSEPTFTIKGLTVTEMRVMQDIFGQFGREGYVPVDLEADSAITRLYNAVWDGLQDSHVDHGQKYTVKRDEQAHGSFFILRICLKDS